MIIDHKGHTYYLLSEYITHFDAQDILNPTIVEVGYGDLGEVMELYYGIEFSKYIGIDKDDKDNFYVPSINPDLSGRTQTAEILGIESKANSRYEKYNEHLEALRIHPYAKRHVSQRSELMSESRFNSLINIFNQDIFEHIQENRTRHIDKPLIGIFNKVFHLKNVRPHYQRILNWFINLNDKPKLIVLKVFTEKYYDRIPFSPKDIADMINLVNGNVKIRYSKPVGDSYCCNLVMEV